MDKLIALKTVITRVYISINVDGRREIVVPMGSMFHKPLLVFDEAYKNFIETVAKSPELYDRWLNIQMQVFTELQDDQDALSQFRDVFYKVLKGTEGGESFTIPPERFTDTSFAIALAFRVYLDAVILDPGITLPKQAVTAEGADQ